LSFATCQKLNQKLGLHYLHEVTQETLLLKANHLCRLEIKSGPIVETWRIP